MMNKYGRSRLINLIIFFACNTRACGKIKLFKLLYLLDFEHFKLTGKSVTGFEYQAWKFGPVPVSLMEDWEQLPDDMQSVFEIVPVKVIDYYRAEVRVKEGVQFNDDDFTPRQLRLMNDLIDKYGSALSEAMIDVTHVQNGAWARVWQQGMGAHENIPYEMAIPDDDPNREILLEVANNDRMYENAMSSLRNGPFH